ncbi:uncharacterized protein LOC122396291 isoform X3 [Colletes gigas]|uniref:uncharacterized protein LOC122396291 isoform X3 n=1 Tax=Colletes gigas TaxID=935657 RepID=UPI001C9B1CBD|nr:uncharacterized protein LOC122396291 isoform X3 [Colletes gigas]
MSDKHVITKLPHHVQQKLCNTRPPYRQGKRLTSVKVYTINDESKHLMVCGVPKLQLHEEVKKLIDPYGEVKKIHVAPDYPTEEFTEAYYVQYARIQSAREQYHRKKKTPALPLTKERLIQHYPGETLSSIYDGIPRNIDPRPVSEPSLPSTSYSNEVNDSIAFALSHAPYHPTEAVIRKTEVKEITSKSNFRRGKRKNYKGQTVDSNIKVKVVRPEIVDTSTIVKWNKSEKNLFSNPKKIQSNITIKLIPKSDNEKKRIVIKDPSVSQLVQPSKDLQISIEEARSQIRAAMQANNKENPS